MWKARRTAAREVGFGYAARVWLQTVGFDGNDFGTSSKEARGGGGKSGVGKFLNRLLGLPLVQQNLIFETFAKLVESRPGVLSGGLPTLVGVMAGFGVTCACICVWLLAMFRK